MVRRLFRQVRRGLGGGGVIVVQRAAQIPFGFAAFFGKEDRRQQPPAQQPADQRHDPRAEAGLERWKPGPRAAQHLFPARSEEHTSELQSLAYLVCRLLLEKKKKIKIYFKVINCMPTYDA